MKTTQSSRCPRLLIAATLACLAGHAHPASAQDALGPRVRSCHPAVAALLARATEGSATFRRELEAIQATNGLVYIDQGQCGHGVRACLLNSVTTVGGYRLLRVKVDLQRSERDIIASLGHELQHAIEVLSDPYVTDDRRLFQFYQREAPTSRADKFETQAAINAGVAVYEELASGK
jgi:DNA-binding sugar fermentation-stimulating protein